MNRKAFLKALSIIPLTGLAMKLSELSKLSAAFATTDPMPVLFLGHGSPMNAIEENEFVAGFREAAKTIPTPSAILCISAHWETRGTRVTAMPNPRTIHDFGGFPQALFDVRYPAPGSPELAAEVQRTLAQTQVELDDQWGLDHGAWSVIKHLYPMANVPVVQLSLDYNRTPQQHYALGQELAALRRKGVLIIGSGNMVHNLRQADWHRLNDIGYAYDWASEAREKMNAFLLDDNHDALIQYNSHGSALQLAIPTPEHYLPLLYVLGLKGKRETVSLFNDKALGGSLTMTSVRVG